MRIVNVNVENQQGISIVTFRGEGGEAVEVRLAADHASVDDAQTVANAIEMLSQVASQGEVAVDGAAADGQSRTQQDMWSGAGYRGPFQGR